MNSIINKGITVEQSSQTSVACRAFLLSNVREGQYILDVGCGDGSLIAALNKKGCKAIGVEIDSSLVHQCRASGMDVCEGRAENLPYPNETFDGIICSVVLPYTDQRKAVMEWARVLKPGGFVQATYHGSGYALDYLTRESSLKTRFYGFRMLVNTVYYQWTRTRLPGFFGDTLCQTRRAMQSCYVASNFLLDQELIVGEVAGKPRFLCHRLVKR